MRVLLDEEQVIEVRSIIGFEEEESGKYTVFFEYSDGDPNDGIQFAYEEIALEEAKERAKALIRTALEKGYVDCSKEPWEIME